MTRRKDERAASFSPLVSAPPFLYPSGNGNDDGRFRYNAQQNGAVEDEVTETRLRGAGSATRRGASRRRSARRIVADCKFEDD